MPLPVPKVRWRCPQCHKSRWYKPFAMRQRRFCSRECAYAAARVPEPVRAKQSAKHTFGERPCDQCHVSYVARSAIQRFCSRPCQLANIHERRVDATTEPRPCESCGKSFRPRPGNAGRFCSRACLYSGSRGEKAANWRGGRYVGAGGYVRVHAPDHPFAQSHGGYVTEHRLVMEQELGRYLEPHETVHHINGDRADNRLENLQLRSGKHGKGVVRVCLDCGSHNVSEVAIAG